MSTQQSNGTVSTQLSGPSTPQSGETISTQQSGPSAPQPGGTLSRRLPNLVSDSANASQLVKMHRSTGL